ncbi:hypothetical protein ACYOEI_10505 [Singulisphaera rosea]
MEPAICFQRLLITVVIGSCFGVTPSLAQTPKSKQAAETSEKPPEDGKQLPKVSVLRLELSRPEPGPQDNQAAMMRRMRRFNGFNSTPQEGTTLTLLIEEPEAWLLGLDAKKSKITKFTDSRDTDLTLEKPAGEVRQIPGFPQQGPENCTLTSEIDPSGHFGTLTIHSPHLPATGSARLLLEADLVLKLGHGQRTIEQKNVKTKGDVITVGPSPLVIMGMNPEEGNGQPEGTRIMIFHDGPIAREVQKFAFFGSGGNEIKSSGSGSGSSNTIEHLQFVLPQKVETCTVQLTVPKVVETVTLSISIDTVTGFSHGARRRIMKSSEPE